MSAESTPRQRLVVGATAGAAWITGLFVAAPLVGGFGVNALAEAVIVRSPGWLSTLAISTLGFSAKPVLVGGVILGIICATSGAALVWPTGFEYGRPVGVGIGILATVAVFVASGTGVSFGFLVGTVVAVAPPYLVARGIDQLRPVTDRRKFLRQTGSAAVGAVASLAVLRLLFARFGTGAESERVEEPLERSTSPPEGDPAFDFEGMPSAVTSTSDHYVIDINVTAPRIDPESWTLTIDGEVEQPYELGYDELLEHDAAVDQTTTMLCISNQVGGDLIGTGHWTGVQLSDLVGDAVPNEGAVDVVTYAEDGYNEAIPIDLIEREDIMIAFGMNGQTLASEHGFPARLLIPGRYGMKMTKWINRIEVVAEDHEAYWEARNWTEEAVVNTMSYIRGATRDGETVQIGGVAFAGLETGVEEVAGVEVSIDGGETWTDAELEPQIAPHAWRRWRHEFEAPDRVELDVVVRAIHQDGTVQTEEKSSPRPNGSTGWHRRTIEI
ncbi:molybdopterin-dependent oxidoreductase [Natronoarchaeum sp. GCM10025321]|uniref:molybdopterin-dependent oxidoreductase n=1 Tax=Natronoarchaeum sp. GCM10025321 TaxID=3252684 RepID=UPI003618621D